MDEQEQNELFPDVLQTEEEPADINEGFPDDALASMNEDLPEETEQPEEVAFSHDTPDRTQEASEPVYYAVPAAKQRKRRLPKARKARKGLAAPWVILLSLLCALLGGIAVGAFFINRMPVPAAQENAELARRVAALEKAGQQTTARQAYSAQQNASTTAVYEQNVSAVVGVTTAGIMNNAFGQSTNYASSGSGFIVRDNGYVLTNYHIVQNAQTMVVKLQDGEEYTAEVVGYDADFDVAVLKIDATELPTVTLGDSDLLRVGDQVAAIGNPLGELTLSMTVGYISALDREINADGMPLNMLQTDVAINSGNSGGPLFDMKGNVVGITTAKFSGATSTGASIEGIGFALPINDVMLIADDLIELGYISGRAYLGVTAMEMDEETAKLYSLPLGVYVNSVTGASCAEKAGVRKGDIILALGDHETPSYSALRRALLSAKPGEATTLSIYRAGAELTLQITLDERPADEEIEAIERAANGGQAEETPEATIPAPDSEGGDAVIPDADGSRPDGNIWGWFDDFFGE